MTSPDLNAFAKYIPGFEFLHNLTRQAAGTASSGEASPVPGMPSMSHWVAPTFDVEELDKRIQDLRAVHFWLDQNTKALAATIQALEVQKMTLATLKGMNVSLAEMAEAFTVKPEAAQQPAAAPAAPAAAKPAAAAAPADSGTGAADAASPSAAPPLVDPMQWWNALTEQFQTIATGAVRDMADQASRAAEQVAQTVQASADAVAQRSAAPEAPARPPAPRRKPRAAADAAPAAPGRARKASPRAAAPAAPPAARRGGRSSG